MSLPKFNLEDLAGLIEAGQAHAIPIPSFEPESDAVKAFKYSALTGDYSAALNFLGERFALMLAIVAPKANPKACLIRIVQGLPTNGSLKSIKIVEYKQEAVTKSGKTFAATLDIAQECLDDPSILGLAVAYGAVQHAGAVLGIKVSSNRARAINKQGSELFAQLGLSPAEDRIKSPKGSIHGLYGYVPSVTASFLKSFGLDTPIKVHGARPNGWTWGQLVKAIQAISAQGSEPSDWIKLECGCSDRIGDDPQVDASGESLKPEPVLHGARFSDVVAGYFRPCCLGCGSAWRLDVDDNGKPEPVRVTITEAGEAIRADLGARVTVVATLADKKSA